MRRMMLFTAVILLLNSCSALSEFAAFTRCEFRLHSLQDLEICNIKASEKSSWTDFSYMEGQVIAGRVLNRSLPVEITANIEVRNPGATVAAVNAIQWILMIDELQVAQGSISDRVVVEPEGGLNMFPVRIQADFFDYLKGENAQSMLNLLLNLINASKQDSQMILKIKPSVLIKGQEIFYPEYFQITKEFKSGN